ncbi:MAG: VgrG-related protein [Anaerolineales bacterium]|nr:VgrG-related protein [Anaerolineales bacterium]MCB9128386.1 VgrG-related protein [Ardenticatenales bacterium]
MADMPDVTPLFFKIDGETAPPQLLEALREVVVERTLYAPSMAMIRLLDQDMAWLEADRFPVGAAIELFVGERPPVAIFSGKVAALEPELDQQAPMLVVRCYDLAHRLYRGRHRRAFHKMTDSEIAAQMASEAGLQAGQIDDSGTEHLYLFQRNQSNAEFLHARAQRLGFKLWVEDDKLNFGQTTSRAQPIRLKWGEGLRWFAPRLATGEQVDEVEVRGWDPIQKRVVVGRATSGQGTPVIGLNGSGAAMAQHAWGGATVACVDAHVRSPSEAERLAQAMLDELAGAFVEAEGRSDPLPELLPGGQVEVEGVGSRFSGTYTVTQLTHEWSQAHGLESLFSVSGHREKSLWGLLQRVRDQSPHVESGLVIGIVTDNNDPEAMGRCKVHYPTLGEASESAWARLATPMGGAGRGFFFLPEIDDEVLVGFEHGDIHRPYILGALWNGSDSPPLSPREAVGGDGAVNRRIIQSRAGHQILLDDTNGSERITIIDKTGDNRIVIDSSANAMEIAVAADLTIQAGGKIKIEGAGGIELVSDGEISAEGQSGIDVTTPAQLSLSGSAGAAMSSEGPSTVEGSLVNINGSGTVTVKGGLIQLN